MGGCFSGKKKMDPNKVRFSPVLAECIDKGFEKIDKDGSKVLINNINTHAINN